MTSITHASPGAQPKRRKPAAVQPSWLSVYDVSVILHCSEKTVRNFVSAGLIEAVRFGPRMLRIDASELDRLASPVTAA